jgi:hypothetical protein
MGQQRWYYRNADEWDAICQRLKQTPCPHCKVVGMLIRHGSLYGYDGKSTQRKTRRARRIFCSNRNARRGCGRTFSVSRPDKIRRLSLTTRALFNFLKHAAAGTIAAAIRAANCHLSAERLFQYSLSPHSPNLAQSIHLIEDVLGVVDTSNSRVLHHVPSRCI